VVRKVPYRGHLQRKQEYMEMTQFYNDDITVCVTDDDAISDISDREY
jgi:hypothetical protein